MQNIWLKPVQLVGGVVTCVICFIVALDCVLFYLSVILGLLLFMFSCTGCTYLCVETIANAVGLLDSHLDIFAPFSCGLVSFIFMMFVFVVSGWRSLRLVVLVFERCPELHWGVFLFVVGCFFLCDYYDWSYWFLEECLELMRGCVTLWCRLLVILRPLCLVRLVLEECLELCGGMLLFNVGC